MFDRVNASAAIVYQGLDRMTSDDIQAPPPRSPYTMGGVIVAAAPFASLHHDGMGQR